MSVNKDINILRDKILVQRIEYSDTLSNMVEKSNNSFNAIVEWGGGPKGPEGPEGPQGIPARPKNPIHVWVKGEQYDNEIQSGSSYEIIGIQEGLLSGAEYKEGHCIFLENGHVYVLEVMGYDLIPVYKISMQSYNPNDIVNGKHSRVHFAYANSSDGVKDFTTGDSIREDTPTTYSLRRTVAATNEGDGEEKTYTYMGVCSDYFDRDPETPISYIWTKIQGRMGLQGLQGEAGPAGPAGPKGDKGDGFTGHPYVIDLEGDMSTINIDIDRTRLYDESNDYCECVLHAYYGNDSWFLPKDDVTLDTPKDENGKDIGTFTKIQDKNDVRIQFVPNEDYVFPTKNLQIPISVNTKVDDPDNGETYNFERKTIWIIKPLMATFELEIRPAYRVVKIYDDGERYPKNLEVFVYKIEDTKRSVFDLSKETDFTLLWKYQDDADWNVYSSPIPTENATCIELQIVRYWKSTDPEKQEDVWDYEDVWTVADGKGTHYYHGDLGSTESMMVLTTGEKLIMSDSSDSDINDENCIAELRDPNGYSIIFEPHFYDGSTPLSVIGVDLATSGFDMENLYNGRFDYTFEEIASEGDGSESDDIKYKFTVTQVPYGVNMIPLSFNVRGGYVSEPKLDINGEPIEDELIVEEKIDTVSFNVYISTMAHIYTLQPSVSTFNTSNGVAYDKNDEEVICDSIGCSVYRDGQEISSDDDDLALYNLTLKWFVHQEDGSIDYNIYTEPLVFGEDEDIVKDHFQSNDVMIEFVLYYGEREIVKSTVPLIKDGMDGRDGESWQYIFVRSNYYPFKIAQEKDGIMNPNDWRSEIFDEVTGEVIDISSDLNRKDNASEFLGPEGTTWVDDHMGVDESNKYEYQSYRRWDVNRKEWGIYCPPTLYSNFAKDGVDGSGFLTSFSNPVAVIPVGESGYKCEESLDPNVINQKDSTEVYFYNGPQNLSKYQDFEIFIDETSDKKEHFRVERINSIWNVFFEPVVYNEDGSVKSVFDFGDEGNRFSIGIKSKYKVSSGIDGDEFYEGLVRWTLSPLKGLEDYEVFVDRHVVNTTVDNDTTLRVGYYKISSNGGRHFVEKYSDADGMNIKIHNSIDPEELKYIAYVNGDSWNNCYYKFGNSGKCFVILMDKDNIIDYTSVESVKDGYNGYHLELSEDYIALPWNEDKTGVNSKYDDSELTGKPISSKMILYTDNYEDVKSGVTYEVLGLKENTGYEVHFEIDGDGHRTGGFTIPKEMIGGDNNITCRATYQNVVYEKKIFIDLEDVPYELNVIDRNILRRDADEGKLLDESISVAVKYWMDGIWKYTDEGIVALSCNQISEPLKDGGTSADKQYVRKIMFNNELINNGVDSEVKISYYKDDIDGEELSYEYIGIIDNGKKGSSPYRLDLSNENVTLACDSDGNVYGTGYDKNGVDDDEDPSDDVITTTVTLFYGSDIIKLAPGNVTVTYNNIDIASDLIEDTNGDGIIEYTLPATFLNTLTGSNNSINFKVIYEGVELNATMSIGKIKSQYRYYLRPSVSSVSKYQDGSYSVSNVKCALWKQDGSKKPIEVTDPEIVSNIIKYKFKENGTVKKYNYNNGVAVNDDYNEIWFEAAEGDVLWDREIVPVLKDGKDGSSPSCIAVNVLGYSKQKGLPLYEGMDGYDNWKATIDLVKADAGDTVYILQEYTWRPVDAGDDSSKDYTTRGITSTVAGVQGSNGRILFYLGSFQPDSATGTATLTGDSIYGRLTKTVCDYYIDYYGNAWMRTGAEDADGSDGVKGNKYGNNSLSDWEQAQTVGFIKAGAITADMINTGSLVADKGFINSLSVSDLTIKASRVDELDNKIATATNSVVTELTKDYVKSEDLKSYATTNDLGEVTEAVSKITTSLTNDYAKKEDITSFVSSGIETAKSGIISEARNGMASNEMVTQVGNKLATFQQKVENGTATTIFKSDNFNVTEEGDVSITGKITAEELLLVDGTQQYQDCNASFVFDIVTTTIGDVLCPVLRWRDNNGDFYEIDMSSLVRKLNETTPQYRKVNMQLYTLGTYSYNFSKYNNNIYQKYLNGILVDNKYYLEGASNDVFTELTGSYYIQIDAIGAMAYSRSTTITGGFSMDDNKPDFLMFVELGVFCKCTFSDGVLSKDKQNCVLAYMETGVSYKNTEFISEVNGGVKMSVYFTLPQYNICVPSSGVKIWDTAGEPYFVRSDIRFGETVYADQIYSHLIVTRGGSEINDEDRLLYGYGLDRYVDINEDITYNCVDICDTNTPVQHYTYTEIMTGVDSDWDTEYNWLKAHDGLS